MSTVMAVTFVRHGRLYYVDPGDVDARVGDRVLVPTEGGPEVATVVWASEDVDEVMTSLPVCVGLAAAADLERDAANARRKAEVELIAKALIGDHGLPMKLVGVDVIDRSAEYGSLVAIYYTAPHRVDFRALLGDLARSLKSRIDLRQVGSRDAARLIGGIGSCGRDLCCSTFLDTFEPISKRFVRGQELVNNPLQIQGQCGRLKCCLAYERPLYEDFDRRAPAPGTAVDTPDGPGVVVARSMPTESVTVRTSSGELRGCALASVCVRSGRTAVRPSPGSASVDT